DVPAGSPAGLVVSQCGVMVDGRQSERFRAGDRVVVIANPATRVRTDVVTRVLADAAPQGVRLDIRWTDAPGAAVTMAREAVDHAEAIVAAGGDGTVSDVASALIGTDVPLGILPGGSTNIIAQ